MIVKEGRWMIFGPVVGGCVCKFVKELIDFIREKN